MAATAKPMGMGGMEFLGSNGDYCAAAPSFATKITRSNMSRSLVHFADGTFLEIDSGTLLRARIERCAGRPCDLDDPVANPIAAMARCMSGSSKATEGEIESLMAGWFTPEEAIRIRGCASRERASGFAAPAPSKPASP